MRESLEQIRRLIGYVDHAKGNGPNSAIFRGMLLNEIRAIVESELTRKGQTADVA